MSDDEYVPLHWQPDIGGAQAAENLRLMEWAQRTRKRRMLEIAIASGRRTPSPDECAYCGTTDGQLVQGGLVGTDTGARVAYRACASCARAHQAPAGAARGHGCAR